MALVKCSDCGRSVSSNAVSCPACGNPLNGSSSVGNTAFEKRIEQYTANGYLIIPKRTNDSVHMTKMSKFRSYFNFIVFACALIIPVVLLLDAILSRDFTDAFGYSPLIMSVFISVLAIWLLTRNKKHSVHVYISKTGQIVETGNVLKKK